MSQLAEVTIYTDGACSGNPGPGGWGAYLIYKDRSKKIFGHMLSTTNNKMELTAVIEALAALKKPCYINLYTDSQYVHKGITEWIANWEKQGWRKKHNEPVKNVELWQKLQELSKIHHIMWYWVKAHNNNAGNVIADALAVQGRKQAEAILKCA